MQLLFPIFPVAEALHGSAVKWLCSWRLKGHLLLPDARDAAILWEETVLADLCPAFCHAGSVKRHYSALESHWNCSLCLGFYVSAWEERRSSILGAPSIFSCQEIWRGLDLLSLF